MAFFWGQGGNLFFCSDGPGVPQKKQKKGKKIWLCDEETREEKKTFSKTMTESEDERNVVRLDHGLAGASTTLCSERPVYLSLPSAGTWLLLAMTTLCRQ